MDHPAVVELSRHFEPHIRARGEDYYRRDRVRIAEASAGRVLATVEGSRRYTVELLFRDAGTEMFCSCPYFLDFDSPCKHLWALILKLDAVSYFSDPGGASRSHHTRRGASGPPEFGGAEGPAAAGQARAPLEERRSGGVRGLPAPPASARPARPEQSAARHPVPQWKQSLQAFHRAALGGRNWARQGSPEARELWYVVDVGWSRASDSVMLLLYEAPPGSGQTPAPIDPGRIPADAPGEPVDADERDILAILSERSLWTDQEWARRGDFPTPDGQSPPLPVYRLSYNAARLLLPKICRLGRCRLLSSAEQGVHLEPAELDDGPAWELKLSLDALAHALPSPAWSFASLTARPCNLGGQESS